MWGATYPSFIDSLATVQKKVIRIIDGLKKYDHTNDTFKKLKLLKMKEINEYFISVYVFNSLNLLENNIFNYRNNPNYQLRNPLSLQIPQIYSSQSKSCILYHGVAIWNSLPLSIRNIGNINTFKRKLKEYLLSHY